MVAGGEPWRVAAKTSMPAMLPMRVFIYNAIKSRAAKHFFAT